MNGDINVGVMSGEEMDRHRWFFKTFIKFLLMTVANSRNENDLGKPHWKAGKQSWGFRDCTSIMDCLWKLYSEPFIVETKKVKAHALGIRNIL